MHIRLLAVGDRQPSWVDAASSHYAKRLPRQWRFRIETVPTAARRATAAKAMKAEGDKLLARLQDGERVVLLDERGRGMSSRELAARLEGWQADGRDLVLLIGGPDGVDKSVAERADEQWSLSPLTLAHGLARVVVVEQLYRAWALSTGHPYHRD